jgi:hypothetical protein
MLKTGVCRRLMALQDRFAFLLMQRGYGYAIEGAEAN